MARTTTYRNETTVKTGNWYHGEHIYYFAGKSGRWTIEVVERERGAQYPGLPKHWRPCPRVSRPQGIFRRTIDCKSAVIELEARTPTTLRVRGIDGE